MLPGLYGGIGAAAGVIGAGVVAAGVGLGAGDVAAGAVRGVVLDGDVASVAVLPQPYRSAVTRINASENPNARN